MRTHAPVSSQEVNDRFGFCLQKLARILNQTDDTSVVTTAIATVDTEIHEPLRAQQTIHDLIHGHNLNSKEIEEQYTSDWSTI